MRYLDLDGGRAAVRVTRVGADGFDWVTLDGSQAGAMCRLPLYDDSGAVVQPDAEPSADGIQRGLKLVVKALAQTNVIAPEDALEIKELFDPWAVGLAVAVGAHYRYRDGLYRVVQAHTTQADWTPDITHSLWARVAPAGEIPEWTPGSWEQGAKVRHKNKVWQSMTGNNIWEPGAAGVFDNIWKEVI